MGVSGTPSGDFRLWGTTALYGVLFDVNGDTNGAWYFGDDDEGIVWDDYWMLILVLGGIVVLMMMLGGKKK